MAASKNENLVDTLLKEFTQLTHKPENFLSVQNNIFKKVKNSTKKLYDFGKSNEKSSNSTALPELITENFDDEQIWQELELQNQPLIGDIVSSIAQSVSSKNRITFDVEISENSGKGSKESLQTSDYDYGHSPYTSTNDHFEGEESDQNIDERLECDEIDSDSEAELDELLNKAHKQALQQIHSEENDSDEEFDSDSDLEMGIPSELKSQTKPKKSEMKTKSATQKRKTIVDDKFFKMADMEAFLDHEDAKEERMLRKKQNPEEEDDEESEDELSEDDEDIDMFQDIPSDDEEGNSGRDMQYEDFFDPPDDEDETENQKKAKFDEDEAKFDFGEEDDEDEQGDEMIGSRDLLAGSDSEGEDIRDILQGGSERRSTFEKRQERLKQKITSLEEGALSEKPWQLTGEVTATARPENSLLQEDLHFDHMTRQAPVITEETTKSLEDIIIQRIKDKAYDDVERKIKPTDEAFEYKKRITLDQEKSKLSLGEVYEQEYIKQTQAEEEEKEDPQHEEIQKMMSSLFVKLDALSNFHYTPKPAAPEIKIVSNLPSINMEEVAPVSVSEVATLAPEEIQEKQKGELKGTSEKTKSDRLRERKEKKARRKMRQKEKERRQILAEKLKPGIENKYAKEHALEKLEKQSKSSKNITIIKEKGSGKKTQLTSSKAFFSHLQEEVTTHVKGKTNDGKHKAKEKSKSSAKLKL